MRPCIHASIPSGCCCSWDISTQCERFALLRYAALCNPSLNDLLDGSSIRWHALALPAAARSRFATNAPTPRRGAWIALACRICFRPAQDFNTANTSTCLYVHMCKHLFLCPCACVTLQVRLTLNPLKPLAPVQHAMGHPCVAAQVQVQSMRFPSLGARSGDGRMYAPARGAAAPSLAAVQQSIQAAACAGPYRLAALSADVAAAWDAASSAGAAVQLCTVRDLRSPVMAGTGWLAAGSGSQGAGSSRVHHSQLGQAHDQQPCSQQPASILLREVQAAGSGRAPANAFFLPPPLPLAPPFTSPHPASVVQTHGSAQLLHFDASHSALTGQAVVLPALVLQHVQSSITSGLRSLAPPVQPVLSPVAMPGDYPTVTVPLLVKPVVAPAAASSIKSVIPHGQDTEQGLQHAWPRVRARPRVPGLFGLPDESCSEDDEDASNHRVGVSTHGAAMPLGPVPQLYFKNRLQSGAGSVSAVGLAAVQGQPVVEDVLVENMLH